MKIKVGYSYQNIRGYTVKIISKLKKYKLYVGVSSEDNQIVQLFTKNGVAVESIGTNYNLDKKLKKHNWLPES